MSHSFTESPSYLFTSESVTEGHPDKLCDQISDAVLDAILTNDPMARVACEACVTTGLVIVMGEITTDTYVDIPKSGSPHHQERGLHRFQLRIRLPGVRNSRLRPRAVPRHIQRGVTIGGGQG